MLKEKEDIKKPWDWKFLPVPTGQGIIAIIKEANSQVLHPI